MAWAWAWTISPYCLLHPSEWVVQLGVEGGAGGAVACRGSQGPEASCTSMQFLAAVGKGPKCVAMACMHVGQPGHGSCLGHAGPQEPAGMLPEVNPKP